MLSRNNYHQGLVTWLNIPRLISDPAYTSYIPNINLTINNNSSSIAHQPNIFLILVGASEQAPVGPHHCRNNAVVHAADDGGEAAVQHGRRRSSNAAASPSQQQSSSSSSAAASSAPSGLPGVDQQQQQHRQVPAERRARPATALHS